MTIHAHTHIPIVGYAPKARICPTCKATHGHPCTTTGGHQLGAYHKSRITGHLQTPGPGRPTTLTPHLQEVICQHLANGVTLTTAAQAAGIHYATLNRWINLADSQDPDHEPFREFREAVLRARAEGAARLVDKIIQAGDRKVKSIDPVVDPVKGGQARGDDGEPLFKITYESDWKAHAWVLERAHATEWGKRSTVQVEYKDAAEQALVSASSALMVDAAASQLHAALREVQGAIEAGKAPHELVVGEVVDGPEAV